MMRACLLVALLLVSPFSACSSGSEEDANEATCDDARKAPIHNQCIGGAWHRSGYEDPIEACGDCHGNDGDLDGTLLAIGCTDCHQTVPHTNLTAPIDVSSTGDGGMGAPDDPGAPAGQTPHPGPCTATSGASVRSYTYRDDGQMQMCEDDRNGDGEPDATLTRAYDAQGQWISQRNETQFGVQITTRAYDAEGRLIRSETVDADGTTDRLVEYTYDAAGRILTENKTLGVYRYESAYTYADGRVVQAVNTSCSPGFGDPLAPTSSDEVCTTGRISYRYDDHTPVGEAFQERLGTRLTGNALSETHSADEGNRPDRVYTYAWTYDGSDRPTAVMVTDDMGAMQEDSSFGYDDFGNVLMERRTGPWPEVIMEHVTTHTYDEHGNELMRSVDRTLDGTPETVTTYTYECW